MFETFDKLNKVKQREFTFGVKFWVPFSGRERHARTRHDCSQEITGSGVVWRFDVGATWTRMLNGKAYGRSQWFLSLHSAASGLEKPLLAGYVFGCNFFYHGLSYLKDPQL